MNMDTSLSQQQQVSAFFFTAVVLVMAYNLFQRPRQSPAYPRPSGQDPFNSHSGRRPSTAIHLSGCVLPR